MVTPGVSVHRPGHNVPMVAGASLLVVSLLLGGCTAASDDEAGGEAVSLPDYSAAPSDASSTVAAVTVDPSATAAAQSALPSVPTEPLAATDAAGQRASIRVADVRANTPEQQAVADSYIRFRQVQNAQLARAVFDEAEFAQVATSERYELTRGTIAELAINGQHMEGELGLFPYRIEVMADTAVIADCVNDQTVFVDDTTGAPVELPYGPAAIEAVLVKTDSTWLVQSLTLVETCEGLDGAFPS